MRPGPQGNWKMGRGGSRGEKRPSGNISVTEDFLEEESVDQGSNGKGMRIPIKKGGGGSGALARKGRRKGLFRG